MALAEELKKLIDNPDDLSTLPDLVSRVAAFEKQAQENEEMYQNRITTLQESNRAYLQLIPVEGTEPPKQKEEPPSIQDAMGYLSQHLNGGNQ